MQDLYDFLAKDQPQSQNTFLKNAPDRALDKAKLLLKSNENMDMIETEKP